jgi:hypothetical protein
VSTNLKGSDRRTLHPSRRGARKVVYPFTEVYAGCCFSRAPILASHTGNHARRVTGSGEGGRSCLSRVRGGDGGRSCPNRDRGGSGSSCCLNRDRGGRGCKGRQGLLVAAAQWAAALARHWRRRRQALGLVSAPQRAAALAPTRPAGSSGSSSSRSASR